MAGVAAAIVPMTGGVVDLCTSCSLLTLTPPQRHTATVSMCTSAACAAGMLAAAHHAGSHTTARLSRCPRQPGLLDQVITPVATHVPRRWLLGPRAW